MAKKKRDIRAVRVKRGIATEQGRWEGEGEGKGEKWLTAWPECWKLGRGLLLGQGESHPTVRNREWLASATRHTHILTHIHAESG